MTIFSLFQRLWGGRKKQAVQDVVERAKPDRDYFVLLIGAILLAIGAIFTDSIPLLIASMIVAPLSAPILALGLGLAAGSVKLVGRSLVVLVVSCALSLGIAMVAAMLFGNARTPDILISFNGNMYIAFCVAAVSGAIAAYGAMRPKVSTAATGIAIAVSLMPPLVATGIGLAPGGEAFAGAALLFALNVVGIAVASAITFAASGAARSYRD
jgi:uncharacterized hydrophobic protein (TIGR00271 family)